MNTHEHAPSLIFNRRVVIVQRRMTHYRVALFELMRKKLIAVGIDLVVVYGDPTKNEIRREDGGLLQWGVYVPCKYMFGDRICWQNIHSTLNGADLVILSQENKLINNLIEQFFFSSRRVAFWGHGANLQGKTNSLSERLKCIFAKHVDWWFGYTALSLSLIVNNGFPSEKITILNNSVDTREMILQRANLKLENIDLLRQEIGLTGQHVGVYVGSLSIEKKLSFLLKAAEGIRQKLSDFEFLIVGAGPEENIVTDFCKKNRWAHYLGKKTGQDKINIMALASVILNPGAVGLGVLDSFACDVPLVTTDCGLHGPEISYLENNVNGVMVAYHLDDFIEESTRILTNESIRQALVDGCRKSISKYSLDNMAKNFATGIARCLAEPIYRVCE